MHEKEDACHDTRRQELISEDLVLPAHSMATDHPLVVVWDISATAVSYSDVLLL